MLSESARMSSAEEARFRIQAPLPTARAVVVIPLDPSSERLTKTLSERAWNGVRFLSASAATDFARDVTSADLAVMVATAGADAGAAATIGEDCSQRRIPTATCVIREPAASDDDLSATLAQIRPWSLMVVVTGDRGYVEDILRSFR